MGKSNLFHLLKPESPLQYLFDDYVIITVKISFAQYTFDLLLHLWKCVLFVWILLEQ